MTTQELYDNLKGIKQMEYYDSAHKIEDIEQSVQELFDGFPTEPTPDHEFPIQYKITVIVERL